MSVFTGKSTVEDNIADKKGPGERSTYEDFADLIKSRVKLDWNELKAGLPEMPTEALIWQMIGLGLYVNKTIALEVVKIEKLKKGLMQDLLTGRKGVTPETGGQKKVR